MSVLMNRQTRLSFPSKTPTPPSIQTSPPALSSTHCTPMEVCAGRFIMKCMILENFKSYAGKQCIGPFHKCFNAVVGPNGSGKSNVIDGLQFVFGKRANAMRLKKMSDLIHRSDGMQNLEYCAVSVHFVNIIDTGDGEKEYHVVPNSEIVVRRHVTKKNISTYFVNEKTSSWTEVTNLFKSRGVDLDNNRFLILQGEIESIALMKPKAPPPTVDSKGKVIPSSEIGLLEFIEDIIGSRKFLNDIEKAATKLEQVNNERTEKLQRVKHAEKERDALNDSKNEAIECQRRSIRRDQLRSQLLQLQLRDTEIKLNDQQRLYDKLLAEYNSDIVKLDQSAKLEETILNKRAEAEKELSVLNKECTMVKAKMDSLELQNTNVDSDISNSRIKIDKATSASKKAEKKLKELQEQLQKDENDLPNLEKVAQELEKKKIVENEKLQKLFDEAKSKTEPLRQRLEDARAKLLPKKKVSNDREQELKGTTLELELLNERARKAHIQSHEVENEIDNVSAHVHSCESQVKAGTVKLEDAKLKVTELQHQLEHAINKEQQMNKMYQQLLSSMEERKLTQSSHASTSSVVTALRKASDQGDITGFHGRLGDLGTIDLRYDIAVSTACPSLNHIVVDSTAAAQACVSFLRHHNIGRATFIPLDKMRNLETKMKSKITTPEHVPRLFDLIKVDDERYRPAFYFAMRDTLVTDSLEQATRIAFSAQRWRVVTCDGKLIETAGTMSGGGGKPNSGLMSRSGTRNTDKVSSVSPDPHEESVEIMQSKLDTCNQKLLECRNLVRSLQVELNEAETGVQQQQLDVMKLNMEHGELRCSLEALRTKFYKIEKEKNISEQEKKKTSVLEDRIKKQQAALHEAVAAEAELNTEVSRLQNAILEAGGQQVCEQQEILVKINTKLSEVSTDISRINVSTGSSAEKQRKLQIEIAEHNKNAADTKQVLQEYERKRKSIMQEFENIKQQHSELDEQCNSKRNEVSGIEKDYQALMSVLNKLRVKQVAFEGQLAAHKSELYGLESQKKTQTSKLQSLLTVINSEMQYLNRLLCKDGPVDILNVSAVKEDTTDTNVPNQVYELLSDEVLDKLNRNNIIFDIKEADKFLDSTKAGMRAIVEWCEKDEDYRSKVKELDKLTKDRDIARAELEMLNKSRHDAFMEGFTVIALRLKEMYQMLTIGGDAELELVNTMDPFSEGITFGVRPYMKSWKQIANLSGGEKTLSSLALVFALHVYKPTPLYVIDEIDAALDYRNVSIVGNYIKEKTKDAQFIVISHRNDMFELADRLIGIYKPEKLNQTKSITVDPRKFHMPKDSAAITATTTSVMKSAIEG